MSDLTDALARDDVADAFDAAVSLFAQGISDEDEGVMMRAGQAFYRLRALVGAADDATRDRLLILVRDAAAEAVRKAAGMEPLN